MKNNFFLGMAVLLVFAFGSIGCNGTDDPVLDPNDPNDPVINTGESYSFSVSTDSIDGVPSLPLSLTLESTISQSISRAVDSGSYTFTAELLGIIISTGDAVVMNDTILFTPADGEDGFEYDGESITGVITITQEMKDEIEAAAGQTILVPNTIELSGPMKEGEGVNKGGSAYWNGTWIRHTEGGDPTDHKITFNGSNYTLTNLDGSTETGTFVYCAHFEGDSDVLFIFSRPDGTLAVYFWEGMSDDPDYNFIELYNHIKDPMGIALDTEWEPDWDGDIPESPSDPDWDDYTEARMSYPRLWVKQ